MPSFELLDKVELFLRTRTFPAGTAKSAKRVTRAASKHYVYRGMQYTVICSILVVKSMFCSVKYYYINWLPLILCPLDGLLWRSYRGRFLRVVRSDEEVRELLTRYHDNNNHAGRSRAVKEIMVCLNGSADYVI